MKLIDPALDPWQPWPAALPAAAEGSQTPSPDASPAHALLSLPVWLEHHPQWPDGRPVGLALANTDDVECLTPDQLEPLGLVTVHFPKSADGRAYSQAHLLRRRLRLHAPLRATGHVIVDMLPLLWRCGVDEAVLSPGQSPQAGLAALRQFPAHYQADARQPWPPYRRAA